MRNSISSIESSIKLLYERFFQKLKINKKNGEFMRNSRWSFLKFPTYPFIGREYAQNEDCRVLFIGLEIGSDELPNGGIIDFEKKRERSENNDGYNTHFYGMAVATIFSLGKPFKRNQWRQVCKGKTYKEVFNLAKEKEINFKPLDHVAMTNCYKFVTKRRKSKLGSKDAKHISSDEEWDLLKNEIRIFKPRFLVFQGAYFKKDYWLRQLESEIEKENRDMKVYFSHHPSARGLHSNAGEYLNTIKPSPAVRRHQVNP
jgi:hypothetical protein